MPRRRRLVAGFLALLARSRSEEAAWGAWNRGLPAMPTERMGLAVGAVGGGGGGDRLFAIGGYSGSGAFLRTVEAYHVVNSTWVRSAAAVATRLSSVATLRPGRTEATKSLHSPLLERLISRFFCVRCG